MYIRADQNTAGGGGGLRECILGRSLMNKASHSSGISLTFTADLFILWFKSQGLSYLRGIKQGREYTHTHKHTHAHTVLIPFP